MTVRITDYLLYR